MNDDRSWSRADADADGHDHPADRSGASRQDVHGGAPSAYAAPRASDGPRGAPRDEPLDDPRDSARAVTETIAASAADWIVRLSADDATERREAQDGYEAWKRADPRHLAIAASMEHLIGRTRGLARGDGGQPTAQSTQAARAALDAARPPRSSRAPRRGLRVAVVAGVIGIAAALGLRLQAPADLLADLHQPLGSARSTTLADGSTLTLAGGTAVDLRLGGPERHITLRHGAVLLDVAKDPNRPLVVQTAQGSIRALGTRFLVRHDGATTWLTMIESRTSVATGDPAVPPRIVAAGQRVRITAHAIELLPEIDPGLAEDAFRHQRLVAQDRPLTEVLDELAQHRHGLLRYRAEALAGLRVTAVLPLDDTDRALDLLAASFSQLRIRRVGDWLAWVDVG